MASYDQSFWTNAIPVVTAIHTHKYDMYALHIRTKLISKWCLYGVCAVVAAVAAAHDVTTNTESNQPSTSTTHTLKSYARLNTRIRSSKRTQSAVSSIIINNKAKNQTH